jgi:hypothetical protein
MPKALYKFMRDPQTKNPNPMVITPTKARQDSRQVKDYLLCAECEDRFSKNGETWVCGHCWRSDSDFPLRATLLAATPLYRSGPDFAAYSGSAITHVDVNALVYYAASVMWRGAVHQWRQYEHIPTRLHLGPYREELRQFLLGVAAFPRHVAMVVSVSTTTDTQRNSLMVLPWLSDKADGHHRYGFVIPGITFRVTVGKGTPPKIRNLCLAHSPEHYLFMSKQGDADMLSKAGQLIEKTM